jgi:hypothetical protein
MEKSNLKKTVRNSSKKLANEMVAVGVALEPAVEAEGLYTKKMRVFLSKFGKEFFYRMKT